MHSVWIILIESIACTSFPESNADFLELPAEAAASDTTATTKLETNIDGDPKNYVAVQPVYEWKEITGEFFDAVKGMNSYSKFRYIWCVDFKLILLSQNCPLAN